MTTIIDTAEVSATIDEAILAAGGGSAYSQGFESGLDSFVAGLAGSDVTQSSTQAHSGTKSLRLNTTTGGAPANADRTLTGLDVGREYVLTAWVYPIQACNFFVSLNGNSGTPVSYSINSWHQVSVTFIATATTHTIGLYATIGGSFSVGIIAYWDDVDVARGPLYGDLDLLPASVRLTLDETAAPYVKGTVEVPYTAEVQLAAIDPRDGHRMTIDIDHDWVEPAPASQSRSFDLFVTGRRINHRRGVMTLSVTSDESILLLRGATTASFISASLGYMLRTVVNAVLNLVAYPAVLEAGAADADITVTTDVTNQLVNPSFENASATFGTTVGTGASSRTLGTSSPTPQVGTNWLRFTAASGAAEIRMAPDGADGWYPAVPLEEYVFTFYLRSSTARSVNARLRFYSGAGSGILATTDGAVVTSSTSAWTRYTVTAIAPAGTAYLGAWVITAGNAAGNQHYIDGAMLTPGGSTIWPFFSGATAADAYYSYAWAGTANASASQRTRLDDRDSDSLLLLPGTFAWDFIYSLVSAAGLRLFCDEQRRWYLVDPASYAVAGTIAIGSADVGNIDGDDIVDLEDGDYADTIVARYRWISPSTGELTERVDVAGSGEVRTLVYDFDTPYPGPGAAAAIVTRTLERGRQLNNTATLDLDATPAMDATVVNDAGVELADVISAVTFHFTGDGASHEMDVRTRGAAA